MLVIIEAPVDDNHEPQDICFSHLTEVNQAQSKWMMISKFYQHRYQLEFFLFILFSFFLFYNLF